ncbi:MAG: hypothetical protein ABIS18_05425 [Actinomycetota bacterium]
MPSDTSKMLVSGPRSILVPSVEDAAEVDEDELRPLARALIELAFQMLSDERPSKAEEEQAA